MRIHRFYKYFTLLITGIVLVGLIYYSFILGYKLILIHEIKTIYAHERERALTAKTNLKKFDMIKEIPKDKPVRILILEGGGLSGIISSKLLVHLEKSSGKSISDLFDIIGGTSIGALQAAILTLPGLDNKPKYTAEQMLYAIKHDASIALDVNSVNLLLSGFGLSSPIIDTIEYNSLLEQYIGNVQLSQLISNVFITGYDINNHQILFFKSRKIEENQKNFLVSSIISGVTSIPIIMPPQQITNLSGTSAESYLISDPSLIINNPLMATILYANLIYPENKKIVVFLGLGLDQKTHTSRTDNDTFSLSFRIKEYYDMRWAYDKLMLSFLSVDDNLNMLGLSKADIFYIDEVLDNDNWNNTDRSIENINEIETIGDLVIEHHKELLAKLIKILNPS